MSNNSIITLKEGQILKYICPHIHPEYADLKEAFSQIHATQLPSHRISLTFPSPRSTLYCVSSRHPGNGKYISEALKYGFIRPSTSPASAVFFVEKKNGGLWPSINYRGLNEIIIKYSYPLTSVPMVLEQLREVMCFTKFKLSNVYNLTWICEGYEWKRSFSTYWGHCKYQVMPFGFSNSPPVFHAFMNDIFRDMVRKFIIMHIVPMSSTSTWA